MMLYLILWNNQEAASMNEWRLKDALMAPQRTSSELIPVFSFAVLYMRNEPAQH